MAARVVRRIVGDVRGEIEAAVAAIGLKFAHLPAAHVETRLNGVRVARKRQIRDVLKGALVAEEVGAIGCARCRYIPSG